VKIAIPKFVKIIATQMENVLMVYVIVKLGFLVMLVNYSAVLMNVVEMDYVLKEFANVKKDF
jgi:hypothetical protein